MGLHEAMIPASFVMIAIFGIALASINISTALKLPADKRDKNNFNFSIFMLVAALLGFGVAGYFAFQSFKAPSAEVVEAAIAQSKNLPNLNATTDAVPTSEQIQTLMTPNNVRTAQSAMNAEIDKTISGLMETKTMKGSQLQARLQGLIAAAQAMAAATAV
jgi:hypothetical protein